jgi:D-lactate dehydrogenase (cytochrome)
MLKTPVTSDVIERLKSAIGVAAVLDDDADMADYLVDERRLFSGKASAVLRPASTEAVAKIVSICAESNIGIVPQGGNTGLCGGSVPDHSGRQVLLSLSRMNRIRDLDPVNYTLTAEAGCVLEEIQRAAREADRLFTEKSGTACAGCARIIPVMI